jgi:hypothetical protein
LRSPGGLRAVDSGYLFDLILCYRNDGKKKAVTAATAHAPGSAAAAAFSERVVCNLRGGIIVTLPTIYREENAVRYLRIAAGEDVLKWSDHMGNSLHFTTKVCFGRVRINPLVWIDSDNCSRRLDGTNKFVYQSPFQYFHSPQSADHVGAVNELGC